MAKITCIVQDTDYPATEPPLIYVVSVTRDRTGVYIDTADAAFDLDVMAAVREQRSNDLGNDSEDNHLELLFAFEGEPKIVADWRG